MKFVRSYRGYSIWNTKLGYYLIKETGQWDFDQIPFYSVGAAKEGIDKRVEGLVPSWSMD